MPKKLRRLAPPFTAVAATLVLLFALQAAPAAARSRARSATYSKTPITLKVDLTGAARHIFHAEEMIPVKPGPITLLYPKWIPGEHGPTGPITNLAGLVITANGKRLAWQRDRVEMFAFHVEVPRGASTLDVHLDYLSPNSRGAFTAGPSSDADLALLSWNTVLLYPAGYPSDDITYQAQVTLPEGWHWGTALPVESAQGNEIHFKPSSLTTLVDSPVLSAEHLRVIPLSAAGETPHEEIDLAGDSEASIAMPQASITAYKHLVKEARTLFGSYHYRDYHFLFTVSDHSAHFGLEHHESSDDRVPAKTMTNREAREASAGLLPHEFVHSWNGKYRRPAGLATSDYEKPMIGDLLWVYEGLTEYLGDILTARSGLWSPQQYREHLASVAAGLEAKYRPGRTWRPLADTARAAQILYGSPMAWSSWRRGVDFYDEGELLWLDVDTTIRGLTHDQKSIDDFCQLFHGGPSGEPVLKPYTFNQLVEALNRIAPYDWRGFFEKRVYEIAPEPPLAGINKGGWELTFNADPNKLTTDREDSRHYLDLRFSLGITVNTRGDESGSLTDVIPGLPAAAAGLAPGMKITAIDGRSFSPDAMRAAISSAQGSHQAITLLVEQDGLYHTYHVDYHGGERYPHLVRRSGTPDWLGQIIAPHVPGDMAKK